MIRFLFYSALNAILFVIFLAKSVPIFFLFAVLSIYYFYRAFKVQSVTTSNVKGLNMVHGILGNYDIEGNGEDESFGLFMELAGRPVFIDIREDNKIDARKERALFLYENRSILEVNLLDFINKNQNFMHSYVNFIGLHADNLEQGEVFWEPHGYTLLIGLNFQSLS